jgi:tetratricopeptide (TPR) repeat protein
MSHTLIVRELEFELSRWPPAPGTEERERVDLLNKLAWALSDTEMQRAYSLAEQAHELAAGLYEGESYRAGVAASLRTLGYINQRLGDFPRGLTQLYTAQQLLESLGLLGELADAFDGLAGIYYQVGDLVVALELIQRQLKTAQMVGDERRVANAYNNLAHIYHDMGDTERTLSTFHANLRRAVELDYERMEFLSCANLAWIYGEVSDFNNALQYAARALEVAQRAGFELFEAHAFDITGKIYLRLGRFEEALGCLEFSEVDGFVKTRERS